MAKIEATTAGRSHPCVATTLRLPHWMHQQIEAIAIDTGVSNEDIMKIWIAERLLKRRKNALQ